MRKNALVIFLCLVPAAALSGRLHAANNDTRRAAKIVEAAYRQTPHPNLATVYLRMRRGDSAADGAGAYGAAAVCIFGIA